ncbi:phosphoribosylanthranilate isomerase [Murimonas intestini]|uniref:phosphoribosylanthranilate isomerase n=1 Tax=Murimonas intestini TaxID=1337051 RepID=UPI0011DD898B|nr:phosphoribosylanthranilate isomerase [Murimonas intestini]
MKDESLVKVKICGLTSTKEASLLYKSGADYTGLVLFYEKSRRNNTVANAWQILRYVPREIQRVAVTVSPTLEQLKLIEQMDFHILQVHGELREEVAKAAGLPIWRAYNISGGEIPAPGAYDEKITGYVLDGAVPGAGRSFDWSALADFDRRGKKLILAGGLKADNVCQAIETLHPDVVDVSSGVETDGGKDAAKIKEFVRKVKQYG